MREVKLYKADFVMLNNHTYRIEMKDITVYRNTENEDYIIGVHFRDTGHGQNLDVEEFCEAFWYESQNEAVKDLATRCKDEFRFKQISKELHEIQHLLIELYEPKEDISD